MLASIKHLFWSSRPVSWVNTAFPFAAGYLFINGWSSDLWFWLAVMYFLIPYNMAIYVVNDVYDYESDMLNPRKGGVEGAVVPKQFHKKMLIATCIVNVVPVVLLCLRGSTLSNLVLLLCVGNALAYSVPKVRLKERPVLDSISSSLHFVGPLLFALAALGISQALLPYAAAFFFWGMASHAFGAVQDIIPDRKAGLSSIATFFGAHVTIRASVALYMIAIMIIGLQGWPEILVAILGLLYPLAEIPFWNISDKNSSQVNRGWRHFMSINMVIGFVITMLLIIRLQFVK